MTVNNSREVKRLSLILRAGTALPLVMCSAAHAQEIVRYEAGDIVVAEATASGTPVAVDVYSTGGNLNVAVGAVTGSGDVRDDVVYLGTEGAGAITAEFGSITASGGTLRAALIESDAGDIDVTVGAVTINGPATAGVQAFSNSGNVTVRAEDVRANGTGFDPAMEVFPEAVLAYSGSGAATAIVGNAETFGQNGSAVIAFAGTDATVVVDTATAHSDGAVAVLANGVNSASVTAGTVTMTGNGTAVEAFTSGNAIVDVDNALSGGRGIYVEAGVSANVTAGNVTGASGIFVNAGPGAATSVTVENSVTSSQGIGVQARGGTVNVTMAEGSSVVAAAAGIVAEGQTSAIVSAHDVTSGGQSVRAVTFTGGPVSVNVTGDLVSTGANAVSLTGDGVTLSIAEGASVTSYGGSASVAIGGRGGDVSIDNAGEIVALANAAGGIGVTAGGNITINSNSVLLRTSTNPVSAFNSSGINADSLGGNVAISAASVVVDAPARNGISASVIADGSIDISAETVFMASEDRVALRGQAENGNVTLTGGTVTTTGSGGVGAYGFSTNGDVTIALDNVTTTGLGIVNDHASEGAFAESTNGFASVVVGTASILGEGASGAVAVGGAGTYIQAGSVTVGGLGAAATFAQSRNGSTVVELGSAVLAGDSQGGVTALGLGGDTSVSVGSIVETGSNGRGVFARARDNVTVRSGTIETGISGITGRSDTSASIDITTTGNTLAVRDWAIQGIGGTVSVTTGTDTLTQGGSRGIWIQSTDSAAINNQGTVAATGGLGSAILVSAPGPVSIVSDTVTVTGPGVDPGLRPNDTYRVEQGGIIVEGGSGPVTISSGTVDVAGDHRYGISVRGDGPITIDAGTTNLASADSVAIVARGGAGDVSIAAGTTVTTGASGVGIFGNTSSGNVSIVADETRVENSGIAGPFTGDAIVGISTSGNVSIISNSAVSAAEQGSAIYGYSGSGDVLIDSGYAATTGQAGYTILAGSASGDVSISAARVESPQPLTSAVAAYASNGRADVVVGDVTAGISGSAVVDVAGRAGASLAVTGTIQSDSRAINLVSSAGMVDLTVNNVSSPQRSSLTGQTGANLTVGGTFTGGIFGSSSAGSVNIRNNGRIEGPNSSLPEAAIMIGSGTANAYIYNDGTISSAAGIALLSQAGSTTVELTENTSIQGVLRVGDTGFDRMVLDFVNPASGVIGQVAASRGFESLDVETGYWVAGTGNSTFEQVSIASGATLEIRQANDFASVIAPVVQMDGNLALNFSADTDPGDFTGLLLQGTGALRLNGDATVLFDDTSGLQYTGGTFVENGTLLLTADFELPVQTSGEGTFQLGDGGTSGSFTGDLVNDGRFVFARSDDYTFTGDFSGTGALDKYGDGQLVFAGEYAFDGLSTIYGGSIALSGTLAPDTDLSISGGIFDLSRVQGGMQTIGSLSGTGGSLILGSTALTIAQSGTTTYGGDITGTGQFIVNGTGDLKLSGAISFTGEALVQSGTLSVNGSMTGANFVVSSGGKLGGNGSVGQVVINQGTLGAGNSIGTLNVLGDLTLNAGSTFEIEVSAAGAADLVNVTGVATLGGASASVLAEAGTYAPYTEYTVLTAGSISGTFGTITSNYAFLSPDFAYGANAVTLILRRNDIAFSQFGTTPNQSAIGALVEDLGVGNPLYNEALRLSQSQVVTAFESLSGEAYPAFTSAGIETADMLRRQVRAAPGSGTGLFGWATGLVGSADGSEGGYRNARVKTNGLAGGLGYSANGVTASLGVGKLWQDADGLGIGDADGTILSLTLEYGQQLGLSAEAGVQMGWNDATMTRTAVVGGLNNTLVGDIDSEFTQLFGEVSYGFGNEQFTVSPVVGLSHIDLDVANVAERGGAAALLITGGDREVTFGRIGAKARGRFEQSVWFDARAAYRRAWGDRRGRADIAFAGNGQPVAISAMPIARGALELGAQFGISAGRATFTIGYDGSISDTFDSHGGRVGVSFRF